MIGGVIIVSLDYISIAVLDMGITGAAVSTGVGYAAPGFIGLFYFLLNRKGTLYLTKPKMDVSVLIKSCTNGSSEMVTNLSQSVITILLNNVLMKLAGTDGVASITIILYAQGLLNSAFMGFSIFGSSMFTALSDGRVSAIISFMRSLVFVVLAVLLLPLVFQLNGVWLAIPVAEALGLLVTLYFTKKNKEKYQYI